MMKIGTFAQKYLLNAHTVRYYINEGLLIPERKNNQYYFDEACHEDMELILQLRDCFFSVKEIQKVMSIKRLSQFKDESSIAHLLCLLKEKRGELSDRKKEISAAMLRLNEKIEMVSQKALPEVTRSGLPLEFMNNLVCPHCDHLLLLKNANLSGNHIYDGDIYCDCGYKASVESGIIVTPKLDRNAEVWYTVDKILETLSQEYMYLLQQSYTWMYTMLPTEGFDQKVIMSIGETAGEFIFEHINRLGKSHTYIIYDFSKETVAAAKKRLDAIDQGYKIVYIAGNTYEFPIKRNSVDLFIDDFSSYFDLFDGKRYLVDKISPILKEHTMIAGLYPYYEKRAKSLKNIKAFYPHAGIDEMNLTEFRQGLSNSGFTMIDQREIGVTEDPGLCFEYHEPGDAFHFYTYLAQR